MKRFANDFMRFSIRMGYVTRHLPLRYLSIRLGKWLRWHISVLFL